MQNLTQELGLELDMRADSHRLVAARVGALDALGPLNRVELLVSEHRRRKARAFRFEKDRRLSLLAGLLLDELVGNLGVRERDQAYIEDSNGKPAFRDFPDVHFSLAHSGQMAVAALGCAPVGVDVEHLAAFPHDLADPYEWTALESVGKALGCGIGTFVESGALASSGSPAAFALSAGFAIEHHLIDDYLICVAVPVDSTDSPPARPPAAVSSKMMQSDEMGVRDEHNEDGRRSGSDYRNRWMARYANGARVGGGARRTRR